MLESLQTAVTANEAGTEDTAPAKRFVCVAPDYGIYPPAFVAPPMMRTTAPFRGASLRRHGAYPPPCAGRPGLFSVPVHASPVHVGRRGGACAAYAKQAAQAAEAAAEAAFVGEGERKGDAVPVLAVHAADCAKAIEDAMGPEAAAWARTAGYEGAAGKVLLVPSQEKPGELAGVVLGLGSAARAGDDPLPLRHLHGQVPRATRYRLVEGAAVDAARAFLGWGLGAYTFDAYKGAKGDGGDGGGDDAPPQLVVPEEHAAVAKATCAAVYLTRDLINTPANDMTPRHLEDAARSVATRFGAKSFRAVVGDDLLNGERCPLIHAVGRAAATPPRLIDFSWEPSKPCTRADGRRYRVVLVGKGITFDTGGLNLKPGASMVPMKKDMGGAANILGLASMIMASDNPNVELRVMISAAENSVSSDSFRPSDIIESRKGITVEIGNTDAEGRLVLADALAIAAEGEPDLVVDMATLTGAHRVALGKDIPGFFCDNDEIATQLAAHSEAEGDPLWRLPLWRPYRKFLDSKVADINNVGSQPLAGAITAALFLKEFTDPRHDWIHVDLNAMTDDGWGEAQGVRALHGLVAALAARA